MAMCELSKNNWNKVCIGDEIPYIHISILAFLNNLPYFSGLLLPFPAFNNYYFLYLFLIAIKMQVTIARHFQGTD